MSFHFVCVIVRKTELLSTYIIILKIGCALILFFLIILFIGQYVDVLYVHHIYKILIGYNGTQGPEVKKETHLTILIN